MWLPVHQRFELRDLSPAVELHLGRDALDHQFEVRVVLDRGHVELKRSRADRAAEVEGGRGEEEALLVPSQDVRGHDEERDGQAEHEAVQTDPAEAAQRAPAPRQLPLQLHDGEQVHRRVVHLQEQRPFAVVVHRRAQQAVLVLHVRHIVSQVSLAQGVGGGALWSTSQPDVRVWDGG